MRRWLLRNGVTLLVFVLAAGLFVGAQVNDWHTQDALQSQQQQQCLDSQAGRRTANERAAALREFIQIDVTQRHKEAAARRRFGSDSVALNAYLAKLAQKGSDREKKLLPLIVTSAVPQC